MKTIRWSALSSLIGAVAFIIGTIFHPPLTNPWDTSFAFHEMVHHHHWVLDHYLFFLGIMLWLLGLSQLGDLHNSSNEQQSSGGHGSARCFLGSLVMWAIILSCEIAVLPPLVELVNNHHDPIAREIWNALFTWGLFTGYIAMVLVYIGIILLTFSCTGWLALLAKATGAIGIIGTIWSLLLPETALVTQLITAPLPFIWTIWYSVRFIRT